MEQSCNYLIKCFLKQRITHFWLLLHFLHSVSIAVFGSPYIAKYPPNWAKLIDLKLFTVLDFTFLEISSQFIQGLKSMVVDCPEDLTDFECL